MSHASYQSPYPGQTIIARCPMWITGSLVLVPPCCRRRRGPGRREGWSVDVCRSPHVASGIPPSALEVVDPRGDPSFRGMWYVAAGGPGVSASRGIGPLECLTFACRNGFLRFVFVRLLHDLDVTDRAVPRVAVIAPRVVCAYGQRSETRFRRVSVHSSFFGGNWFHAGASQRMFPEFRFILPELFRSLLATD